MTRATSCLAAWKCRRPVTTIGRLFTYLHECTHMRLRIGIPNRDGVWAPWNGSSKGGDSGLGPVATLPVAIFSYTDSDLVLRGIWSKRVLPMTSRST
jgi:hypothetical protein